MEGTALVKVMAALVLFVSVTVCGNDVPPIGWVPKLRLVGTTAKVAIGVSFAKNASEVPFRVV